MYWDPVPNCCGIRESGGLEDDNDPITSLKNFQEDDARNWSHLIFSQAGKTFNYGVNLAAYIKANNLGEVVGMEDFHVNPNTGNPLKVWVWAPNRTAIKAHLAQVAKDLKMKKEKK